MRQKNKSHTRKGTAFKSRPIPFAGITQKRFYRFSGSNGREVHPSPLSRHEAAPGHSILLSAYYTNM